MIVLLVLLALFVIIILTLSWMAYSEGKDDACRYYRNYDNDYWMPMAYAYEYAYNKWDGRERVTTKDKNKKRFNRG